MQLSHDLEALAQRHVRAHFEEHRRVLEINWNVPAVKLSSSRRRLSHARCWLAKS